MSEMLKKIARAVHPAPSSGAAPLYLLVGLGNPGLKYARNRHNVGFQVLDELAREHGITFSEKKRFKAALGEGNIGPHRVMLVKPLTFMNDSGQAVRAVSQWYKVPPERILVIYDELDLPLGRIRLRPDGSSGGHNGLNSLIREMGTNAFARLRIGIGRPGQGDPIDYVLNDFGPEQESVIAQARAVAAQAIRCYLDEGIREAMNRYNSEAASAPVASRKA